MSTFTSRVVRFQSQGIRQRSSTSQCLVLYADLTFTEWEFDPTHTHAQKPGSWLGGHYPIFHLTPYIKTNGPLNQPHYLDCPSFPSYCVGGGGELEGDWWEEALYTELNACKWEWDMWPLGELPHMWTIYKKGRQAHPGHESKCILKLVPHKYLDCRLSLWHPNAGALWELFTALFLFLVRFGEPKFKGSIEQINLEIITLSSISLFSWNNCL